MSVTLVSRSDFNVELFLPFLRAALWCDDLKAARRVHAPWQAHPTAIGHTKY